MNYASEVMDISVYTFCSSDSTILIASVYKIEHNSVLVDLLYSFIVFWLPVA